LPAGGGMFIFTISKKRGSGKQLILFGRFRHRSVPTPPNANSETVSCNKGGRSARRKEFMKNKIISFITLIFLGQFFVTTAQTKNPPYVMKEFKYDKVIAYECKKNSEGLIMMNDKLNSKIIKSEKELNPKQIDTLNTFLRQTVKTEKELTKECWFPYLGVVYYLKGQMVASFNISKECEVFLIYFRVLDNPSNWPNSRLSFTKQQRQRINKLCAELGFTHY
jgi:hypothetical protein